MFPPVSLTHLAGGGDTPCACHKIEVSPFSTAEEGNPGLSFGDLPEIFHKISSHRLWRISGPPRDPQPRDWVCCPAGARSTDNTAINPAGSWLQAEGMWR